MTKCLTVSPSHVIVQAVRNRQSATFDKLSAGRGLAHSKSWRTSNAPQSSARSWSAVALYRFAYAAVIAFTQLMHAAEPIRLDGQSVHPTRILARAKPGRALAVPAANRPAMSLTPRWLVLDEEAPAQPAAAGAPPADPALRLQRRIDELKASDNFDVVEPDYSIELDAVPNDGALADGRLWGLRNTGQQGGTAGVDVNALAAWALTTGDTNVIVGIVDTGIRYSHQDLQAQLWRNPHEIAGNGLDDDNNGYIDDVFGIDAIFGTGDPFDIAGHGTHVAGTIGAGANNGSPHVGVAPNVRLMACRFIDVRSGYVSDALECINYAVQHGARILNNSWGSTRYSQVLYDTIAAARDAGVLFVAAAGNRANDFARLPHYPSGYNLDNIVSVAAIDRHGALASFSNYGSQRVHLGAPGVDIFSSYSGANDDYRLLRGTSMASPHVAGVAALLWSYHPDLSVTEVRRRLLAGTTPLPSLSGKTSTGGRVDAHRALTVAEDGLLEVTVTTVGEGRLLAGTTRSFVVQVSDLRNITNATVTADIGGQSTITFRNDGIPPDTRAGDELYFSAVTLLTNQSVLAMTVTVVAPGFALTNVAANFVVQTRPPNDDFAARTLLSGNSVTLTANNQLATQEADEPLHAGLAGKHSVWWSWVAPADGYVKFGETTANFDYQAAVYLGSTLANLTVVSVYDPVAFLTPSPFPVRAGVTYHIAVDGFRDASGDFLTSILYTDILPPGPANDFFALCKSLAGMNPTDTGNNSGATREAMEPNHPGSGIRSIWWSWTAPTHARVTFDAAGSGFGVACSLYLGEAIYDLTPLPGSETSTGTPHRTFNAAAGRTYQFLIDSQTNANGIIPVALDAAAQTRPGNDDFNTRLPLIGLPVTATGSLLGATWEHREPAIGPGYGSVWWRWRAEVDGDVFASLDGNETNATIAVYTGSALSALARVDFATDLGRTGWHAAAGEEYNIVVSGIGVAEPSVSFMLEPAAAPTILLAPHDRKLFAGRTLRLVCETAGAKPLFHRWFHDGELLGDQTNATLSIAAATLELTGAYTLQVSNALGSNSATVAVNVQPLVPSVGIFNDGRFVESFFSPFGGSEPEYLRAAIERVGYTASFVTNLEQLEFAALVIPNQRSGSMARGLNETSRRMLFEFVRDGGLLFVAGSFQQRDVELIDWLFDFGLVGAESTSVSHFYFRTSQADDTSFAHVPDPIESLAHSRIDAASLPSDALSLFQREDQTLVAQMPYHDGNIVFLGPLFLSVRPIGPIDGGWLALIEAALRVATPPLDRVPTFEVTPESPFLAAGRSATISAAAYGSEPLTYQWYRGEEAVPSATNAVLTLPATETASTGFYYAVARNAFGATTSEVSRLTITPPELSITVFVDPDFVRTGVGATNEAEAVRASIRYFGYRVDSVTNFTTLTNQVVLIPSLANGDPAVALDSAERNALSNHVALGGTLIVHGDQLQYGSTLLNELFGWALSALRADRDGGLCYREPVGRRTHFRHVPELISSLGSNSSSIEPETLPPDSLVVYFDTDDRAIVAVMRCGRGKVIYLGWSWRNAVPLGSTDSGWLTVLAAALAEGWTPQPKTVLSLGHNGNELQLTLRNIPSVSVELQNSVDLQTWVTFDTNTMPVSGVLRFPMSTWPGLSAPRFFRAREN